jgi:hypothetical protein
MAVTLAELAEICARDAAKHDPNETVLWQTISRNHVSPDASVDDWNAFVGDYEDAFAEAVSELAQRWWDER